MRVARLAFSAALRFRSNWRRLQPNWKCRRWRCSIGMAFTEPNGFRLQHASKIFDRLLAASSAWKMAVCSPCSSKTEQATGISANYLPRHICKVRKDSAQCDGKSCRNFRKVWWRFWVAHASRALARASSPSRTFLDVRN